MLSKDCADLLGGLVDKINPAIGGVPLTPFGVKGLSSWTSIALGGLAAFGAMGAIMSLFKRRKELEDMKTQDLVAIMASSIISGAGYQQQLMAAHAHGPAERPDMVAKIVESAVSVAKSIVLAAGHEELKALDRQRQDLQRKVEETKARLEEIARGLDEAIGKKPSVAEDRAPADVQPNTWSSVLGAGNTTAPPVKES